jgi:hypothetical protein
MCAYSAKSDQLDTALRLARKMESIEVGCLKGVNRRCRERVKLIKRLK